VLLANTLPADFLITDTKRTVQSVLGKVTELDFASSPLGSIAGRVVAPEAFGDLPAGPILNAYVVAEPGEHAAITDENGEFIIDNLPSGTYTLAIDNDTLPTDSGSSEDRRVELPPGGHVAGIAFNVVERQRDIEFSFKGSQTTTLQVALSRSAVPPGGATTLLVNASAKVDAIEATAFGKSFPLASRDGKHWTGEIVVPLGTAAGPAELVVRAGSVIEHATLTVDPSLPLVTVALSPQHPRVGTYVTVHARFVAPVRPGDQIRWKDGTVTTLTKAITGRVFGFTVKITELPFAGLLYSRGQVVPITLASGR
jgi:hypothetical protein